ncbi:4Fe-4S dicluster domain-containing protein [Candidatus Acetothermia bacterium]|nr:4Fe-4S dicluster domain-containing protein [Candidatus Acetothermia bacterium]
MSSQPIITILFLTLVGFVAGVAILVVSKVLPKEDPSFEEAERIKDLLPGGECGSCGYPGCFAYAQAVAKDKQLPARAPCRPLIQDKEGLRQFEAHLGLSIDTAQLARRALVHCSGNSPNLATYNGINSCRAAVQLASGFRECPYACLGLADCVRICPVNAITIDFEQRVARVDWEKCIGCGLCAPACPQNLIDLVPKAMPQYLGCNYQAAKEIPGRKRCAVGCIHCRICVKVSPDGEVGWNEKKDLPSFDPQRSLFAAAAIAKCPRKIILKTAAAKQSE